MPGLKNKLKVRRGRLGSPGGGGQTLFRLFAYGETGDKGDTTKKITFSASHELANLDVFSGTGGSFNEDGNAFFLDSYDTAGTFEFTFKGTAVDGRIAYATASIVLNEVVIDPPETPLAAPTGLTQLGQNKRAVRVGFTGPVGAVSYQYLVALESTWKNFGGGATGPWWVQALLPGGTYSVQVRAVSATGLAGVESASISITTDEEDTPGPGGGITPIRAREVSDKTMAHLYLTRASGDAHTAYRRSDGGNTGAYDTSGWLLGHYKPLADVGFGRRIRTAIGFGGNASHQVPQVINKMFDDWGTRTHGTLTMFTAAQNATAGITTGVSSEEAIQKAYDYMRDCMVSFQGVNEPNNPDEWYYASSARMPGGWRTLVIDHTIVNGNKINSLTGWPADLTYGSFSLWSRKLLELRSLLYANYVHNANYLGGQMLFNIFNPYTTSSGKQWIRDCLPYLDWINLHLYTGGWRPDNAGDTGGTVDNENGSDTESIDLGSTLTQYSELANGNANFPVKSTEFGYELGGPGSGGNRTAYSLRFLTEEARCKFFQRWNFDLIDRFPIVDEGVWFEFMDNGSQIPGTIKNGKPIVGKVYGMIKYSQSGGNYTFSRRMLWYMALLTYKPIWDSAANALTFTKTNLDFTLGDQTGSPGQYTDEIRHKLIQHSNGKYYLAVWFNWQSWRREANATGANFDTRNNDFRSRNIKLTLNGGVTKIMRTTRPFVDAQASSLNNTWTSINGGVATNQLNFTVHDDVMYIEMT